MPSPHGWVEQNFSTRPGIRYLKCDGLNLVDSYAVSKQAEDFARRTRRPVFLHMRTVRLLGHAGSDVETTYRSLDQIQATERQDPLLHSARIAIEHGFASGKDIVGIYQSIRKRVDFVGEQAVLRPKLETADDVMRSIVPPKGLRPAMPTPDEAIRLAKLGQRVRPGQKFHFARLHNLGLADVMLQYPNTLVFGEDVAKLFNRLSAYAEDLSFSELLVSPVGVREGLTKLIEAEAKNAMEGKPSGIQLKLNSLVDEQIIDSLYRASKAGVPIDIVVRGMCALRPQVKNLSETIKVRSILGRYLEHSRVFRFRNNDEPLVYIGSADMMHRNLDRRVETLIRLRQADHLKEMEELFKLCMSETSSSWHLGSDGKWTRHFEGLADVQDQLMLRTSRLGS
ncbi:MAG: hypothetical protein EBR26_04945 [Microbacteriaceae bacterium]|nr:hypothetical protein [Microbacteriaceae bacterium]